ERPLQFLSRGRRRTAARHPYRSDLAVQPERCRLGMQRTLGAQATGREGDVEETAFGPWTTRTRCARSLHCPARRSGAQAAERCGRRQGDFPFLRTSGGVWSRWEGALEGHRKEKLRSFSLADEVIE